METSSVQRKLAAILSADVQGYSRLMGADEEGTLYALTACRAVIDPLIHQSRGRIVGTAGDSVLAEFASVVDAVRCAVEIQQQLRAKNAALPDVQRMEFRIGINLGDVMVEGEQIYGDGVNIAARLESLAEAGGICLSGTVYDQVETKLALNYEYLGEQKVKNIARPVRVYRVRLEGPSPPVEQASSLPAARMAALLEGQGSVLPLPDKPSIAVLPFANMSSDPEQEYFSDGITEDLITDLSRLSGLFVIARNSTFTYKGKAVKVEEVGRELGVQYVLEGSVRKAGSRVRITAQLVDALTSHHLWAERYDREMTDIFALQDEIRRKIVAHLAVRLTVEEQESLGSRYATTPEAYDYFLRGWRYWLHGTKETNVQARQMFEKALKLDPSYAEAYAGLGHTYHWAWWTQWDPDPRNLEQAFVMAQKARTLDESSAIAHLLLVSLYLLKGRHEQALAEARQIIALVPNWAIGYEALGRTLNFVGQPEEALTWVEQAMRLDPRSFRPQYLWTLGQTYRLMERYEEAITAQKKALDLFPNHLPSHVHLASIYSELGLEKETQAEAAEILRLSPGFSIKGISQRLPYKDPQVLDRFLAALRKAGLK
jgi:TolB-like protein/class 3 adenylate cyclase